MYQYDSLEKERTKEGERLLEKYDELYFRPKLKKLQEQCAATGHKSTTYVFNQYLEGRWLKWYKCRNCYAQYGHQDL